MSLSKGRKERDKAVQVYGITSIRALSHRKAHRDKKPGWELKEWGAASSAGLTM